MSIYSKLAQIQKELFVPKGQKNTFGGYNYRSCEDILKTVKPLCEANKCVLLLSNEVVQIGEFNYIKANAILRDLEDDTQIIVTAHAREEVSAKGQSASQITGSSSSYARKYALAGLFCIDNEKDADATNDHGKNEKDNAVQVAALRERMKNDNVSEKYLVGLYKVKVEDMTDKHFANINSNWEKIVEGANKG